MGAVPGTALDPDAGIPVLARWVSDGIVGESGYSTTLIVPWPGVTNATIVEDTFDYSLRLQFNDVSMASSPGTQVVIRGPGGSPVDVVEGTVRVLIAQGCI